MPTKAKRRWTALALLAFCAGLVPLGESRADEADLELEMRALTAAVSKSACSLREAIEQGSSKGRVALAARVEHDPLGALTLTVVFVQGTGGAATYVEWTGPVGEECWAPHQRTLTAAAEVAQAARFQTLAEQIKPSLAEACKALEAARTHDARAVAQVLSLEPRLVAGKPVLRGSVAVQGLVWETRQAADGTLQALEAPGFLKEREAAAKRWKGRRLPPLEVPGGVWLNVKTPPRPADWLGSPALVVVTDPG